MRERIIKIIEATTTPHKRFKELEERTGISADSWRKFVAGKQRATSEMIEGVGKMKPEYCQWLLTGSVKALDVPQIDPTDKESEERALTNYADALMELATGMRPEIKPYLARMRPEFWKRYENDPEIALLMTIEKQGHATDEQLEILRKMGEKKKENDDQAS